MRNTIFILMRHMINWLYEENCYIVLIRSCMSFGVGSKLEEIGIIKISCKGWEKSSTRHWKNWSTKTM